MRVMVIVKASQESESGAMPDSKILAEMGQFNQELAEAGVMLSAEGLQPSSKGARVRFIRDKRTVLDGPFAETRELVAGFWLWQVKSMEEAIEWARRCPRPHREDCEIEIRPIFEACDFGPEFTQQLQEQELRARGQMSGPK